MFSVVTNAGIVVFTMHSIGGGKTEAQWGGEWGTFVYIQWACFVLQVKFNIDMLWGDAIKARTLMSRMFFFNLT
ncbi:hypothetical protein EON65_20085 [archaeon]|nr:MAG: hypothetical protein EON65_20085 [archaeon]